MFDVALQRTLRAKLICQQINIKDLILDLLDKNV